MRRATIGIDCRLGGIRHAGIGRYIAEYLKRVVKTQDLQFSLVCADEAQVRELLEPIASVDRQRIRTTIAPIRHYSVAEQLRLPAVFNELDLDLLHVPHFNVPMGYRRPLVVTIHDLLWHSTRGTTVTTLPSWQYWLKYGAYRATVSSTIGRAQRIFIPTQFVADTITHHYPSAIKKLVVTYEGVGEQFVPNPKIRRASNQLLYVGSLYPHKNVVVILDALQQLPEYKLAIVGARDAFSEELDRQVTARGLSDRVQMVGKVTDASLVEWYQHCTTLIQPSTSEGFGLTGIEALACGAPLIASDIPVFREVYGEAAVFFDPTRAQELVSAITQVSTEKSSARDTKRTQTLSRCSWDTMTDRMVTEFRSVLQQT